MLSRDSIRLNRSQWFVCFLTLFYGSFIFNIEIKIEYLSEGYTDPYINDIY